jgi:hypothetical protein
MNMKKLVILITFLGILGSTFSASSQVLSESAKRKVTVGVDLFTDIWLYTKDPLYMTPGFELRTIQQGATAFVMYNLQLGESMSSFSIGLGIRNHNMYSNSVIPDIKADTIVFEEIEVDYRKSKINLVYIDLPVEFKIRSEGGFKLGVGFKVGYMIDSKQKYKGNRPEDRKNVLVKTKQINQLEKWSFGPTLRIGFKWVSVFGYYQINNIFTTGKGPEINMVSVGLTVTPF